MTMFKKQPLNSGVCARQARKFSFTTFLFIPVFLFALSLSNYAATDYSAWQAYRVINVTPSATVAAAAVTNFPLLIHITSSNALWATCNSNGNDIRFTSADGTIDYPFQRAAWNYSTSTGSAEFWVLVPTIAAGPTVTSLRMYWGNSAATDISSGSAVFKTTNNYVAVWHMNAASGTNELDATGSGHDAVQNGTPATVVGPSGDSAKSFDGSTQYYKVNNSGIGSTLVFPVGGPFTISTWINPLALQSGKAILGKTFVNQVRIWTGSYGLAFDGSTAGLLKGNDINGTASERCTYQLPATTWTHLVWVRNGTGNLVSNTYMYINGTMSSNTASNGTTNARNDSLSFCIGKDAAMDTGTATYWMGEIGETQISTGTRDSNWVRLSYKNQMSADTLITFGAVVTSVTAPSAPTLTIPANAATGIAVAPTLTWGTVANATTYRVQVSTVTTFATTAIDDSTLTAGSKAVTGLANNTVYYWRANAKNIGGTSAWTSAFSFTTIVAAPAAPTLATPANAATGIAVTPTLTWGTVSGAATYRVQLSTVSTFATTVVDDSTLTVGSKAITAALTVNKTYYWRVNATNVGGASAWSALSSFTTVTTGVIAATPHYIPATMGHNGVLEVYMANGSRVMEIAYGASATKTQLLNTASKTLAKGYYTYRFRSIDANVEIVGKLIK